MASTQQTPTRFGSAEIRLMIAQLDALRNDLERAAKYADASGELFIFKAPTLRRGLDAMAAFQLAINESLNAAATGQPFSANTRKTRRSAERKLGNAIANEIIGKRKRGRKPD